MIPDAVFFERLSRLRLAIGQKSSMNLTGNRKSVQKGSSAEFSDFREYLPGDDIRRIDWNAYGRLDRLYIKEYMEEKEAVISILLDTSASMDYGARKKSETAGLLAAALAYLGLNNMDRVLLYDMKRMQSPFAAAGGKRALPRLTRWLEQRDFDGTVDIGAAVRQLPAGNQGVTILISDFLQESFLEPEEEAMAGLLRFLRYRRQKVIVLHVLAGEELSVPLAGTHRLIDMEERTALHVTLDSGTIRTYEKALHGFLSRLRRECAGTGAFYAVCNTETDIYQLIFQELRSCTEIV
ncbi:MAG: DUF58 domain-containing protein [Roseburia sp.]|nr:DUF58 domain-containing protein [Roseburia sp.]